MKKYSFLLLVGFLSIFSSNAVKAGGKEKMPELTFVDTDGKTVNSKDLVGKGKITIISYWATWCGPCKRELAEYNEEYAKWKKLYNADFIAISVDEDKNASQLKTFAKNQGWTFRVLHDNKLEATKKFNISGIPFLMLVDKEGNIVHTQTGFDPNDENGLEKTTK